MGKETTTKSGGGGGGGRRRDLISGLTDDLLVCILDRLPDARDVVRTQALSRRWRGLWTGVAALRFDYDYNRRKRKIKFRRKASAAGRYIAFVNGTLALRAAAPDPAPVNHLEISLDLFRHAEQAVPPAIEAARGWIRYAAQRGVKSFVLRLPWLDFDFDRLAGQEGDDSAVVMAHSSALETMHLMLDRVELRLPPPPCTVEFASLTDLSLANVTVASHVLSHLVSSACCRRLQKLRLRDLWVSTIMTEVLLIEADALLELSVEYVDEIRFLELKTPRLRVLHVEACFDLEGFRASAPMLEVEDLTFLARVKGPVGVHGDLSSVRTLKIQLYSHGLPYFEENSNDGGISLLQCCRLTGCLQVSFTAKETQHQTADIIKGMIPPLRQVTSLTLHVTVKLGKRHPFGVGIASLLVQCSSIEYLSLQFSYSRTEETPRDSELELLCDNLSHWKAHKFSLARLHDVEFKNLIGIDCQIQIIQSILTRATRIQKTAISFQRGYQPEGSKDALKLMPPLDGGSWTTCNDTNLSYKWRRCTTGEIQTGDEA